MRPSSGPTVNVTPIRKGDASSAKALVDQALQKMRNKPVTKGKVDDRQAITKMTKLWEK